MLSRTCSTLAAAVALSVIAGCYEEVSPQQPTAQTPPAQPVESGPINDHVSRTGLAAHRRGNRRRHKRRVIAVSQAR